MDNIYLRTLDEKMVYLRYAFLHKNIIKYAGRPYATFEEMNKSLIDNWNQCVGMNDQVFFLGEILDFLSLF
jgi:calcineurin-like phosphoesterase family protein